MDGYLGGNWAIICDVSAFRCGWLAVYPRVSFSKWTKLAGLDELH